jgi:hypothetical protein
MTFPLTFARKAPPKDAAREQIVKDRQGNTKMTQIGERDAESRVKKYLRLKKGSGEERCVMKGEQNDGESQTNQKHTACMLHFVLAAQPKRALPKARDKKGY